MAPTAVPAYAGNPGRTPAMAQGAAPARVAQQESRAYLDHPARIALIFGAFFVLCLPLAAFFLGMAADSSMAKWLLVFQVYSIIFGYTHFAITFSIYLNSRNLQFFRSSPRNIVIYFVGPLAILAIWFLIGLLRINEPGPGSSAAFLAYLFYFALLTKLADYLHVVRQSFGVLQLFKRHVPAPFPRWTRRCENAFFIVLMAMQVLTYAEGLKSNDMNAARFNIDNPYSQLALAAAVLLFVAILSGYALMTLTIAGGRRRLLLPLSYFFLQTASACLPIYWSALYLASLAMHYVEYHVIMYPRVFHGPADSSARIDRVSLWLRSHKLVFYAVLAGFAYLFMGNGFEHLGMVLPIGRQTTWFLLNVFNGIFMAHFFVEAFVWKFGVPFYRETLAPLYFPAAATKASKAPIADRGRVTAAAAR